LKREIRQKKPFGSPEQELFLEIQRTADVLMRGLEELLKTSGLTQTQYNVLRILRGAGPAGLTCHEVAGSMVTHDPDVTRLLDRLESRQFIARSRSAGDRRVIRVCITAGGLELLAVLDQPVLDLHRSQLGRLGGERVRRMIDSLEETRSSLLAETARSALRSAPPGRADQ
jgi:MarR family transcriptional regulator, organic hydroperoxide resistance regulator